jgi:2-polyprenyl-3-methyl-5-hydroxy-6-metoxy-1,4-benzoquinol methylase
MHATPPRTKTQSFLTELGAALQRADLVRVQLTSPTAKDSDLRSLSARPVTLKKGPHICLVQRYRTRDLTVNLPVAEAQAQLAALFETSFHNAYILSQSRHVELLQKPNGRLSVRSRALNQEEREQRSEENTGAHDARKNYLIDPSAGWLQQLGVTNERGQPRAEMSGKLRQIQKFSELLHHLLADAGMGGALTVVDMGCGKGYLTFAMAALLGPRAQVTGIELREPLCEASNAVARKAGLDNLRFEPGTIAGAALGQADVVVALHACDTATDDALARAVSAGARLILVSPCCHKELRPQIQAPEALRSLLRHGILLERQAEQLTDALRAALLEWAGYDTHIIEFIQPEHTARNLLLTARKVRPCGDPEKARVVRLLASHFGLRQQHLASLLGFALHVQEPEQGHRPETQA